MSASRSRQAFEAAWSSRSPIGPAAQKNSPLWIDRLTSSTAVTGRKSFFMFLKPVIARGSWLLAGDRFLPPSAWACRQSANRVRMTASPRSRGKIALTSGVTEKRTIDPGKSTRPDPAMRKSSRWPPAGSCLWPSNMSPAAQAARTRVTVSSNRRAFSGPSNLPHWLESIPGPVGNMIGFAV